MRGRCWYLRSIITITVTKMAPALKTSSNLKRVILRDFPFALRITLLVAGGKRVEAGGKIRFSGEGRLLATLDEQEYQKVRASGAGQFRAGPGTIALIGDDSGNDGSTPLKEELIGYHALVGQELQLNSPESRFIGEAKPFDPQAASNDFLHKEYWRDGPLGVSQDENTPPVLTGGRGVFRTPISKHERNTPICYGTLFIMNKVLLR